MKRYMYLLMTPLLLCGGVISAQPTLDDGESFDSFRDEWNGWVESLSEDDGVYIPMVQLLEQMRDERYNVVDHQTDAHAIDVLIMSRPWNTYWAHREKVQGAYSSELDRLARIAQRAYFASPIPQSGEDPELQQYSEYLPSYWMQEYQVDSVSTIRTAVRYLVSDAVYQAFEGRQEVAVQRFEAASRMCAFALELPTELGLMTELPCRQVLREAIIESIEYDPDLFNDSQLARLQALLITDMATDYAGVWTFDARVAHADWRWSFGDKDSYQLGLLAASYHDDASIYAAGDFSSFFTLVIQPDFDPSVRLAPVSQQIGIHKRILEAMLEDLRVSPATMTEPLSSKQIRAHLAGEGASRFVPIFLDTALWRTQLGFIHRDNYQAACQITVVSIYRHRARHGEWPLSLAAIDPDVLPIPAIDYYSREPLRYTMINNKPRLWALGIDRDDDGGRKLRSGEVPIKSAYAWFALDEWDALSSEQRAAYDGDIRIID